MKQPFDMPFSRERLRQLRKNARALCAVAACENRIHKGGQCRKHYEKTKARVKAAYAAKKEAK